MARVEAYASWATETRTLGTASPLEVSAIGFGSDDLADIERTLSAITIHGDRYPARLQAFVNR